MRRGKTGTLGVTNERSANAERNSEGASVCPALVSGFSALRAIQLGHRLQGRDGRCRPNHVGSVWPAVAIRRNHRSLCCSASKHLPVVFGSCTHRAGCICSMDTEFPMDTPVRRSGGMGAGIVRRLDICARLLALGCSGHSCMPAGCLDGRCSASNERDCLRVTPNSALLTDAYTSPLRAQRGAAKRERCASSVPTANPARALSAG